MKFKAISVKSAMLKISSNQMFLPPIQRSFVWDRDRILKLFDSLYRDYPLGNCIFWNIKPETSKDYPLYRFIREFSESKHAKNYNGHAPKHLLDGDVVAVIDGQQRLSSLFIGLAGSYKYKKSGKGLQDVAANFVDSKLYINLFAPDSKDGDESFFQFLGLDAAKTLTDKSLWFEVGAALKWRGIGRARDYVNNVLADSVKQLGKKMVSNHFEGKKEKLVSMLEAVWRMLHEQRVFYFDVDNQNLDEVVDIFTRINNGGMTLKKSDLLFAVLVAQWNEGRDEIRELVESMRESGLEITQDFVMRSSLMLTDSPVKYNLGAFKASNIKKIRNSWDGIKASLMKLCELLPEIGYINHPNLSENALIPIAYYIMNGGATQTLKARRVLQQYYVVSQVNGIFGGQSDQILDRFRSEISRQLKSDKTINYQGLAGMKLPGQRSMVLDAERIGELVDYTSYGSPHAYFLLSLVYPTVDFKVRRYEIDHIHPRSKFNPSNLKKNGVTDSTVVEEWIYWKRDALPNLELLGSDNQYKGAASLVEYLTKKVKTPDDCKEFCASNLLPPPGHDDLELCNFDSFYEGRKRCLVAKLRKYFDL